MLKVFRDNLKYLSWVLWLVIAVFVLFAFTDFGDISLQGGLAPGTAAAVVGDDEVSYSEFENRYRQMESQYREAYGQQFSRELANQLGLPMQVLNQLIDERILVQEARRVGLDVTDAELQASIAELPVFQQDGAFIGEEAYVALLRRNRLQPEAFESSQREALLTQKLQTALAETVYVSADEIETSYREESETAAGRLLKLPVSRFAADVTVDDGALATFFEEHQEDFRLPERRKVDYLLVNASQLNDSVVIADEEVQAYYDGNPTEFTSEEEVKARHILLRTGNERTIEQARNEIEAIRARLDAGEDFAALASELSDDPGSKDLGGDLGFFGRGAMVKAFEDAAFGAELGDIVGPVESSFGVHLIQTEARRPGGLQAYEEVEPGIRARLISDRAEELAAAKAAELADTLASDGLDSEGLQALADSEPAVSMAIAEPFGRDDNVPGIGRATGFTAEAFDLEIDGTSEALQIARGWVVLSLREIQEPRVPALDEVLASVTADYRQERQLTLARESLALARATIVEGGSFDDAAAGFGVTVEEVPVFNASGGVGSLGPAAEIARQVLALEQGGVSEPMVHGSDVVLLEVTERTHFDNATFETAREDVRTRLESQRLGELLRTVITDRRDELGVTYDPQVFEAFRPADQGAS